MITVNNDDNDGDDEEDDYDDNYDVDSYNIDDED